MPSELFKRLNLDLLYPPFLERVFDVIADSKAHGHVYYATMGYRTYAEQDGLYAQGRTKSGNRVTNAKGGESAHNFGIAVDFTHDAQPDVIGLQPDWDAKNYLYLGTAARARGLVWGGDWSSPDMPHVQYPGYVTASSMDVLRKAHAIAGLPGAWRVLDSIVTK